MLRLLSVVAVVIVLGCSTPRPTIYKSTVIENIDFDYDTVWKATLAAVNRYFEDFLKSDPGDDIVTMFQIRLGEGLETGYEYADRAVVRILPRGIMYDIYIRVDKYVRPRRVYHFPDEGWGWYCRNLDMELKIRNQFFNEIRADMRIRQGHEKFKNKMRKR